MLRGTLGVAAFELIIRTLSHDQGAKARRPGPFGPGFEVQGCAGARPVMFVTFVRAPGAPSYPSCFVGIAEAGDRKLTLRAAPGHPAPRFHWGFCCAIERTRIAPAEAPWPQRRFPTT